jgi:predicted PurR-regulated permease PerM
MTVPLKTIGRTTPPAEKSSLATDPRGRSIAIIVVAASAAMAILHWAQAVFLPIVLSILISYALDPLVRLLMRAKLPRPAASFLIVAAMTGVLGYGGYALSDDASAIVATLPEAAAKLRETMRRGRADTSTIEQVQRAAQELQRTADEAAGTNPVPRGVQRVQIEEPAIDIRQYVTWGSAGIVSFAGEAILVVFFVFFLLASGDLFKRKLVKVAGPSLERRKITEQILNDMNLQIERFLIVLLLSSAIVGSASWIAFSMLGLKHAGVWAIAAGAFNTIPYFGPVIVTGGTAVVALLQFGTISMAALVAGVSLVITSLEGWVLMPLLARRVVRTNEVMVFVALIFWSFVWGFWGTLLAVPMLVTLKACCDRIDDLKPIGELLGD